MWQPLSREGAAAARGEAARRRRVPVRRAPVVCLAQAHEGHAADAAFVDEAPGGPGERAGAQVVAGLQDGAALPGRFDHGVAGVEVE